MRGRTVHGGVVGYFWVEVNFCFSGTRFYSTWRDISATKKAEVRALLIARLAASLSHARAAAAAHHSAACTTS
jgi:hypothetical protein